MQAIVPVQVVGACCSPSRRRPGGSGRRAEKDCVAARVGVALGMESDNLQLQVQDLELTSSAPIRSRDVVESPSGSWVPPFLLLKGRPAAAFAFRDVAGTARGSGSTRPGYVD